MRYGIPLKTWLRHFFLFFFVFLLVPSSFYSTPLEGLDNSWNIAYHLAFKYKLVFGKDFLFTYGPLAILHSRYPIVVNLFVYLFFDIYFLGTLFFVLKKILSAHFRWGPVTFIFLVITVTMYETLVEWYFFFFLFFIFSFLKDPARLIHLIQAIVLSIICFYYKENLGTIAIFTFLATISYALFRKKITGKTYGVTLASFLSGIWLGSLILHVDLNGYIEGSVQIINGYNEAQFYPLADEYTKYLYLALFIILVIAVWVVYRIGISIRRSEVLKNGDELFIDLVLLGNIFVIFKSGFLRADESHLIVFFTGVCFFTGFFYLYGPGRPAGRRVAIGCWVILLVCFWSLNTIPRKYNGFESIVRFSLLPDKIAAVKNYTAGIMSYNKARVASDLLESGDNELRKIIGNQSVDIIPSEISTIYFNGLRYNPRPVIQSYSAYNEYLDSLNAEKYRSSTAPDYILFTMKSIDDRYAFFDEPNTKQAIFDRYEIAGEVKGNLLLKKSANPTPAPVPVETETTTIRFGEDIPLKKTRGLQYSRFLIDYSPVGKIRSLFYTPPLLKVVFTLEDGETRTFRGIKPILKEGVLINKYIESTNDFQLWMRSKGLLAANVSKIRLACDENPGSFPDRITMITQYYPPSDADARGSSLIDSMGLAGFLGRYRPTPIDPVRLKKDSIRYWVEDLKTYSEFIETEGWAFREKGGDTNYTIKVLLRSEEKIYALPTRQQPRPDVEQHFHRTDPGQVGFHAVVSKSQLKPGTYQLGIGLFPANGGDGWMSFNREATVQIRDSAVLKPRPVHQ